MPTRETYPMPLFVKLPTVDPDRSADWYIRTLGFRIKFQLSDPDTGKAVLSHLRREKYQDVILVGGKHRKEPKHSGVVVHLRFEGDIDEFARKARNAGASIVEGPADTHWNTREVTFRDPDGYLLTFSTGPVQKASLELVIRSISALTKKKHHHHK